MKKRHLTIILAALIIVGIVGGSTLAVVAYAASTRYQLNDRGMTYGHVDPRLPPNEQEIPQLIAALGIDGTEGYVYASDLDGDQPETPEEAIKYMENLEIEIAAAKAAGQEYLRYIPLYESDGVTVIGKFGISYPDK